MRPRTAHAAASTAVALAALLSPACSEAPSHPRSASHAAGDATAVSFPLFVDLDEAAFDASCRAFRAEQAEAAAKGEQLFTEAPPEIDWADDVYAAIDRARKEDKPIFLQTHCKQNADTACDV